MEKEELEYLQKVVDDYRGLRHELKKKRLQIEQQAAEYQIPFWQVDPMIEELYKELFQTNEREKFIELVEKAKTNAEFEKYFREANLNAIYKGI